MSLKKIEQVKADKGFKIADLFIYGAVLVLVVALFIAVFLIRDNSPLTGIRIYVANRVVYEYDFSEGQISCDYACVQVEEGAGKLTLTISANGGYNSVEIDKSGKVKVTSADCGKRDCVYTPALSDKSGIIYCSPHQLKIVPYDYDLDGGTIIM